MDKLQVVCLDAPVSSFSEALVCLAGAIGHHKAGVIGKACKVGCQHGLKPLSSTHEQHQHEYAPEDAEGGKERAGLVAGEGVENLFPFVAVEKSRNWGKMGYCFFHPLKASMGFT